VEAVASVANNIFRLSFNKDSCVFVLTDVECLARVTILKKVIQLFIVYLQEAAKDSIALAWVLVLNLLKAQEKMLN